MQTRLYYMYQSSKYTLSEEKKRQKRLGKGDQTSPWNRIYTKPSSQLYHLTLSNENFSGLIQTKSTCRQQKKGD